MKTDEKRRAAMGRVAGKIDRACLGILKTVVRRGGWTAALPAGLGGLLMVHSAFGQSETYKSNLSDIQITHTDGIGSPASITHPPYTTINVPGALGGSPPAGTTASAVPILSFAQVTAATATYQLINTFTNVPPSGPPSSSAYGSIGESDSFQAGMGVYMGVGTGITQTNPGGVYPYASELSLGVQHVAFAITATSGSPFPSTHFPSLTYEFPIGGYLPVGGGANFGVTLSYYFFPTSSPNTFSFSSNIKGTLVTSINLSESFTNSTTAPLYYTNTGNASLFSGSAQFYGLGDQLIKQSGILDIEGSINFQAIVDSPPGGSGGSGGGVQPDLSSTGNGSWTPAPSTFEMYLPQLSDITAGPGAGNTFDANDTTTSLMPAGAWNDITNGSSAPLSGPPAGIDIAQFDNQILNKATTFTLDTPTTWGGISVVNPGAAVTISSGGGGANTLTIGSLGIAISPDAASNGVSQNLTLSGPVALSSPQTWFVAGGQTLSLTGSTLNIGGNSVDIQGGGNVSISNNVSDGGSGGGFQMNGSGTLFLAGANSFAGGTNLNNGEVAIASDANIGGTAAPINFNGGILRVTGNALTNLNSHAVNWNSFTGGFDIVAANNTFTVGQNIGNAAVNSGSLAKLGAGTLVLNGVNTYYGPTTIGGGALLVPQTTTLNVASNIVINSAAGLQLPDSIDINNPITINLTSGEFISLYRTEDSVTLGGPIATGTNPLDEYNLGQPDPTSEFFIAGPSTVTGNEQAAISEGTVNFETGGSLTADVVGGSGIVFGGGPSNDLNLNLYGSSTITNLGSGGATLIYGSVSLFNQSSLNLGSGTLALGTVPGVSLDLAGGTFTSGGVSWPVNATGSIAFNGGVVAAGASNGSFFPATGGGVSLQIGVSPFKFDTEGFTDTIGTDVGFNPVDGDGGLTKEGPGILIFTANFGSKNVNSYGGPTTIDGGLLELPGGAGGAFGNTKYIYTTLGGAVGVDDGSTSDATFLSKMTAAGQPGLQEGGLALSAADASTNIDYTGNVAGAFNMTRPVSTSAVSFVHMSIGALSGGVTYVGTITPAGGSYQLGGGGTLTLATVTNGNNASFGVPLIDAGAPTDVSVLNGGVVDLLTTNTYTGSTTISGHFVTNNDVNGTTELEPTTLEISQINDDASGLGNSSNAATNLVIDGGVLEFNGATAQTSSRLFTIEGLGGAIDASGAGALNLSNAGAESIQPGGMITLTLQGTGTGTLAGIVSDPSGFGIGTTTLLKSGTGTWLLTGVNTYSGGTVLAGGTLIISADSNIGGPASAIDFDGGTLRFTGGNVTNLDSHLVNWSTFNGGLHIGGGDVFTISENLQGTGSLSKLGGGELILSGTNTYSGGTTITNGTLAVSSFGQMGTGAIVDNGTLLLNLTGPTTFSGGISGSGGVTQAGATSLTLNGNNAYTGLTSVGNGSTLILDYSTAASPGMPILAGGSSLSLNGATLQLNPNASMASEESFSATTIQSGPNIINVNSAALGNLTVTLGTLNRNVGSLGATIEFAGPSNAMTSAIQLSSTATTAAILAASVGDDFNGYATYGPGDWAATTVNSGGLAYIVPSSAIPGFYTPLFSMTDYGGTANLDVVGPDQQLLLNSSSFASLRFNTTNGGLFNDGTNNLDQVFISSTINVGAFLVTPNVAANPVLITPNSAGSNQNTQDIAEPDGGDAVFWQNNPSGLLIVNTGISAGGLTKQGPGIMALNATSTYAGATNLEGGILQVMYDPAMGSGTTVNLYGGSLMAVQSFGSSRIFSVGPQGGGLIAFDATTLTINGNISGSGALNIGDSSLLNDATVAAATGNKLIFGSALGDGTVVFAVSNSYTGPTVINAGLLRVANANALVGTSGVNVAAGATLDLNGNNVTIPSLSGGGTIDNITAGGPVLITLNGTGSCTLSGSIKDTTGVVSVTKSNTGTATFSGDNTYSGPTDLVGGELSIGSALNISNTINFQGGVAQITGTTLQNFNAQTVNWAAFTGGFDIANVANTFTVAFNITGNGSLLKLGLGTLALSGNNSYSGVTDVQAGELLVNGPLALGTGPVVDNGYIALNNAGTVTISASLSGSGGLVASGLDLVLTGVNTFSGGTTVNAGSTLSLDSTTALPASAQVLNNGNLAVYVNTSIGGVSGGGTTFVAGGVSFSASGFNQSALINNGATTIGCGGTVGSITGSGTLAVGTAVMVGDLQITGNGGGNQVSALSIVNNSQLDLTNNSLAINFGSPGNDPITTIVSYLKSGYNGGTWTGTGLTSSTAANNGRLAVGYADGNTDNGTPAGPNQLLVKLTLNGDAQLDGTVNSADLLAVIQNFNKTGTDWAHGNFVFGTKTNSADLLIVVQNFNQTLGGGGGLASAPSPIQTAPITQITSTGVGATDTNLPEPEINGLAIAAGAGIIARRRRRTARI